MTGFGPLFSVGILGILANAILFTIIDLKYVLKEDLTTVSRRPFIFMNSTNVSLFATLVWTIIFILIWYPVYSKEEGFHCMYLCYILGILRNQSLNCYVIALRYPTGNWNHGLFNCFDDFGICILSYFVPCVVFGQNAEKIGEGSCLLCGLVYFVPILNLIEWVTVRGKIREHNGIDGTTLNDCLTIFFCPLCALAQEGQEVKSIPGLMSMSRQ